MWRLPCCNIHVKEDTWWRNLGARRRGAREKIAQTTPDQLTWNLNRGRPMDPLSAPRNFIPRCPPRTKKRGAIPKNDPNPSHGKVYIGATFLRLFLVDAGLGLLGFLSRQEVSTRSIPGACPRPACRSRWRSPRSPS